jgi:hypothetical protein
MAKLKILRGLQRGVWGWICGHDGDDRSVGLWFGDGTYTKPCHYRWQASVLQLPFCSRRVIKALAVDADGTSILVTRFVSPTPLPSKLLALASSPPELSESIPQISITEYIMLQARQIPCLQ